MTREQLDELDQSARAVRSVADHAVRHGIALSLSAFQESLSADVTLELVAVYRAALAWNDSRLAYIAALEVFEDKEDAESRSMCQRRQGEYDLARTALVAALGAP